ncbi:N-acetylmuramoyl-L-alanine amidase [Anabaena cylindrica FACHB-243]|uniref:N-acetylmuramoyl-L-alanine amidase n=1 Tax=Anabaena cylindrica (strain ATCC 27899 / PCC 7122) TaxID=272123 RepID=K9ZBQ8_ANACC|nr:MULTISPECIES: N-acetylmuramoyl-L-alanine amidase [Anabaena]AFZ56164.1 N-acetylmuramoyl-L-alanine amidase [Anabaena cylindrica PCC 7122]MBD2417393.1 N-acetylmuramoyl-L-alanine amidase [Anabaena cylindrica FACHB-243]MBY5282772.1 N-acetylmuramoyl-L-alanine amidase [Anabaena sp. CCAP 1446/1C]MBY5307525.1 N-acetylmuramoyl-L-alanine amidase [Anabaena sp. CCAP 1446/1C]MCM2404478.1 N-acetylmuramoyl-L-alanine amidase [Anabaena sp. CCAP 1446/1C]
MKLHYLLPSTVGTILLLSSPTLAAKLESWRFDSNQNRLEINTSGAVQPQAQLIFNPTRLVIDLPNTEFGRSQLTQPVGGAIRSIRVGQFNPTTARLVVELAPGYTLDPNLVKFVGISANRWTVQLPKLEFEQAVAPSDNNNNTYNLVTIDSQDSQTQPEFSTAANTIAGITQIQRLQTTGDGFFIRTNGGNPQVKVSRSRDRTTIFMDIGGATLSPNLSPRNLSVNKHGVSRIEFTQLRTKPASIRMTLRVNKDSPDWRVSNSSVGGLILLPTKGVVRLPQNSNQSTTIPANPSNPDVTNTPATIQSVELAGNNTQLLIRADQTLSAQGSWDRTTGLFRITIPNAKLAPSVKGPIFDANSPVLRVRLQPQVPNTVVIFVQPASGVRIGELNQVGNQLLALQLQRYAQVRPPISLPPLPSPNSGQLPDPNIKTPQPRPRRSVPKGKLLVMIDPGHGGKDPGAVGIGGIQEKNLILPISKRVAAILQQNGVQAVLTRDSDYFVTLPGRVAMAERANADVFVSIHANSVGLSRPDVSGLETYYYENGLSLARTVHNRILQSVNVRDRKVRKARFFVLRKSSMPSILVEVGYVTGREDVAKLKTSAYQNQMAEAIAQGILQYLKQR